MIFSKALMKILLTYGFPDKKIFLKIFFLKILLRLKKAQKMIIGSLIVDQVRNFRKIEFPNSFLIKNNPEDQINPFNEKNWRFWFGLKSCNFQQRKISLFKHLFRTFLLSVQLLDSKPLKKFPKTNFLKIKTKNMLKTNFPEEFWAKKRKENSFKAFPYKSSEKFLFKKNSITKIKKKPSSFESIKVKKRFLCIPVILKILNNLVFRQGLKGFTRQAFQMIINSSNEKLRILLLKLGQNSLDRQKKKKRFINEWGKRNIFLEKKKFGNLPFKIKKFEKGIMNSLNSFKKKKRKGSWKPDLNRFSSKPTATNRSKFKKTKNIQLEENISKTNKTLLTLLGGILKERVKILREATKCLGRFKYLPQPKFSTKKEKKEINFQKTPRNLEKKKKPVKFREKVVFCLEKIVLI